MNLGLNHEDLPDDSTIAEIIRKSKEKALNHLKHFGISGQNLTCQVSVDQNLEAFEEESDDENENLELVPESEECYDDFNDELLNMCEGVASNDSSIQSKFIGDFYLFS